MIEYWSVSALTEEVYTNELAFKLNAVVDSWLEFNITFKIPGEYDP